MEQDPAPMTLYSSWAQAEIEDYVAPGLPEEGFITLFEASPPGQTVLTWFPTREAALTSIDNQDARAELAGGEAASDQTPAGSSGHLRYSLFEPKTLPWWTHRLWMPRACRDALVRLLGIRAEVVLTGSFVTVDGKPGTTEYGDSWLDAITQSTTVIDDKIVEVRSARCHDANLRIIIVDGRVLAEVRTSYGQRFAKSVRPLVGATSYPVQVSWIETGSEMADPKMWSDDQNRW